MNLLILGGTRFVGRHLMEHAAGQGHAVTLFHRGETACPIPAGVRQIFGDRETGDLRPLAGQPWDVVVDTCGYYPQTVQRSADSLHGHTHRYVFVSSMSVYKQLGKQLGLTEEAELLELPPGLPDRPDMNEHYGALKVMCERAVAQAFGSAATIVRPGLVVGPYDPTDRFTYWVDRLADGGDVLAPGNPDTLVQFIDARDLAAFVLELVQRDKGGVYNATGPAQPLTMRGMLSAAQKAIPAREKVRFEWRPDAPLLQADVTPWTGLPLWYPGGMINVDISKGIDAGLQFRPLAQTFIDTLAWSSRLPGGRERKAGITRERERELLAQMG